MTVDASDVKARISLRDLFERDGYVLKRSGTSLVCLSPFGQEKTPSCHVHEKEGYFKCFSSGVGGDCFQYWQETRKCDFTAALEALAAIAGVAPGLTPGPVRIEKRAEVVEELAPPISGDEAAKWTAAVATFLADEDEQMRTAQWRGYRLDTVRWAIKRGLMGVLPLYGVRRVAFPVERPEGGKLVQVAYHVRLGPDSPGNPEQKASWRFMPSRCGSWPFAVGDVSRASVVFALEGQWDVLALVDVMGWAKAWPDGVAVVGMRGATSWKRFLEFYTFAKGATLFGIAQCDKAGERWFDYPDGFFAEAWKKFHAVHGFSPRGEGCKDFNDLLKTGRLDGKKLAEKFRGHLRVPMGKKGKTFWSWCLAQVNVERTGPVGIAAADVVSDEMRPRRKKALEVWERHWKHRGVEGELLEALRAAWTEWRGKYE